MTMKRILLPLLALVVILTAGVSCIRKKTGKPEPRTFALVESSGIFDIETSMGTIRIALYEDTPHHYNNFVKLAREQYYDSVLFHRVIPNFMIQTGDPLTRDTLAELYGTGGPDYTLPAEILPEHRHKKGALAAARLSDYVNPMKESSGSQFYIVLSERGCRHLDGEYTVFGETIDGLDVVDRIGALPTNAYDQPLTPVRILSVREVEPAPEAEKDSDGEVSDKE